MFTPFHLCENTPSLSINPWISSSGSPSTESIASYRRSSSTVHSSFVPSLIANASLLQEYVKHDKEPAKYIKQWTGLNSRMRQPYSVDVGYERFLAPEVGFAFGSVDLLFLWSRVY